MKFELLFKPVTLFLLLASLSIWGVIGVRIYESLSGSNEHNSLEKVAQQHTKNDQNPLLSVGEFKSRSIALRDPFRPQKKIDAKRMLNKKIAAVQQDLPLEIRYVGFVDGVNGRLAILDRRDNETRLCSEGDTAFSIRVIKIEPGQLIVMQKERNRSLAIRQPQKEE